jgi:hypothetical protein
MPTHHKHTHAADAELELYREPIELFLPLLLFEALWQERSAVSKTAEEHPPTSLNYISIGTSNEYLGGYTNAKQGLRSFGQSTEFGLVFPVVDNLLVRGARLAEEIRGVARGEVAPQGGEFAWHLKALENT